MKAVLDTNVVIAGILSPKGPPAAIIDLWAEGKITVVVSPPIIREYLGVLQRPKFDAAGPASERLALLEGLLGLDNVELVLPRETVCTVKEDPADNRVLECALFGRAKYIVSGDKHLLTLGKAGESAIVSPRQFIEMVAGKNPNVNRCP